jgi:outer membrane protein assembly factor BamC
VNPKRFIIAKPSALAGLALALAGCSSFEGLLSGDKVDYRTGSTKTAALEVPPDLTQLARDGRYQPQAGVISASKMAAAASAPLTAGAAAADSGKVAPKSFGNVRIERQGDKRWLVTSLTPDQVWPQLRSFWLDRGFKLEVDDAAIGVLETNWGEDRAKIPQDLIRRTLGTVFDALFDSGLRDKFRTRVERVDGGSEVFVSHRGAEEVVGQGYQAGGVSWKARPTDPALEGEMLAMLMTRIGSSSAARSAAPTSVAGAASGAASAAIDAPFVSSHVKQTTGQASAGLEVNEAIDRAWRQVGLALDRSGFTVEDRDRAAGIYFVRYVDPKLAGRDDPNIFQKWFGSQSSKPTLQRFRISLKANGAKATTVAILNSQGAPDNGEGAQHIVARLLDELK